MRHHLLLQGLLPALATAAIACGGSVTPVNGESSTSSGGGASSSSSSSSSSGGVSSTSSSGTGSTTSSGGQPQSFETNVCTGNEYKPLEGVTAAKKSPVYLELRDEWTNMGQENEPTLIAKSGTACVGASNPSKCQSDLAALRSSEGWKPFSFGNAPPSHRYLVTNSADAIDTLVTVDEVKAFIAPIDTAKDAALAVTATGEYRIECDGENHVKQNPDGSWVVRAFSGHTCGEGTHIDVHTIHVSTTGATTVATTSLVKQGEKNCAIGRRPEGLVAANAIECGDDVGRFFAEATHLEAASVFAFDRLAKELESLGAPRDLVSAAIESRADEVRHARMTAKIAKRFGSKTEAPVVNDLEDGRSMYEIALENAVEGCVRETFGALVAHHQAKAATDQKIARTMVAIAEDETRHAGLAWDVAAWLEPQLDEVSRAKVQTARANAIAELRNALSDEPADSLRDVAGMPRASVAIAMLDALSEKFLARAA